MLLTAVLVVKENNTLQLFATYTYLPPCKGIQCFMNSTVRSDKAMH